MLTSRIIRANWQRTCTEIHESSRYEKVDDRLTMRTTTGRTRAATNSPRRHRWRGRSWLAAVICVAHLVPLSNDIAAAAVDLARAGGGGSTGVCCCGADCRCGPGGCGGAHRESASRPRHQDNRASIVDESVFTNGRRCADALAPQLTQTRPIALVLVQLGARSVPTTPGFAAGPDDAGRHAHSDRSAPSPRGPPTPAA